MALAVDKAIKGEKYKIYCMAVEGGFTGYPYGDTYLKQIQKSKRECEEIATAFYVLRRKYMKEHNKNDIELSLQEQFSILGEAFDLYSSTVGDITDQYHFVWDVIEALLGKDV